MKTKVEHSPVTDTMYTIIQGENYFHVGEYRKFPTQKQCIEYAESLIEKGELFSYTVLEINIVRKCARDLYGHYDANFNFKIG